MLEELVAGLVDLGSRGVALEIACVENLAWEVVAGVEELEEAAYSVEVLVYEVDATFLSDLAFDPTFNWGGSEQVLQRSHH